jgi:hypothetical protein
MTIAAGFKCADGLVFGADTLQSGVNKQYAAKLLVFPVDDPLVVMAGAGTVVYISSLEAAIKRKLKPHMTADEVAMLFEYELNNLAKKIGAVAGELPNLLIGVRTGGELSLLGNDGNVVVAPVRNNRHAIGSGESLGLYFGSLLFNESTSAKWARIITAHLVKQAKDHADGCGGDTHIITLPVTGPCQEVNQGEIDGLERYCADIDDAMRLVLPGGGVTDATIGYRLKMLNEAIERARKSVVIEAVGLSVGMAITDAVSAELKQSKPIENH